jgi:hypothetical protein
LNALLHQPRRRFGREASGNIAISMAFKQEVAAEHLLI